MGVCDNIASETIAWERRTIANSIVTSVIIPAAQPYDHEEHRGDDGRHAVVAGSYMAEYFLMLNERRE